MIEIVQVDHYCGFVALAVLGERAAGGVCRVCLAENEY